MKRKKIIYYLLIAFIAGNLLLVYIQYNSTKNINNLISGNEKITEELKVSNDLRELEKDIAYLDSKVDKTIYNNANADVKDLEIKIKEVQQDLQSLQQISDDDSSVKYIDVLDTLIQKKMLLSRQQLYSYNTSGNTILKNINFKEVKLLNDSIILTTQIIENSRTKLLTVVNASINKSSKKAISFSTILIALVLISGSALFWYIINTIQKQLQLINNLHSTQKKLNEASHVKEKFLANMSHEIRTPVNAIIGFTNLLQNKLMDEDAKIYVKTIHTSGENLLSIVNDILDLSKIEAGMMRIEKSVFDVRALLYSVDAMMRNKAVENKINFLITIDESLPQKIEGDALRLTQILVNLIGNSIKFTLKGNINVTVINKGHINNFLNVGIAVTDTGIGIPLHKLKNIFERFNQAEDDVTRKYGGTGLGLSIVKELILLQNGTINVTSEVGKGTVFTLVIPYKMVEEETNKITTITTNINKTIFSNSKILVVEDNEFNQSLLKHLFKKWQLQFDLANNGKEAIEKLQQNQYDLILMDMQMPEMDGYTATQQIRNNLKLTIPIIAMTAHALAGEREKCIRYGMNEYISKPIKEKDLYNLIAEFMAVENNIVVQKNEKEITAFAHKYIDLQYMKEISAGNIDYEKTVMMQFIETLPTELNLLEEAFKGEDNTALKTIAHNLKTTISIMGLNKILQTPLDALEYERLNSLQINEKISFINEVCKNALGEARLFLASLY